MTKTAGPTPGAAGVRTVRGNQSNRDFPTELRAEPLDLRALVSILV
jgi:hypothetical protein